MTWWGWVASIVLFSGLWFVGNRLWWAFLLTIVGELAWVVIAVNRQQYDLAAICAVFAAVAARNLVQWRRSSQGSLAAIIKRLEAHCSTRSTAVNFVLTAGVTGVPGVTPLMQIEAGEGWRVVLWLDQNWGQPRPRV